MKWKFNFLKRKKTLGDPSSQGNKKGVFNRIRNFGSFLSAMVMPAIGAFIAYGLLAAFIVNIKNDTTQLLAPILKIIFNVLIVSLIGFFGGKQIYGIRGGVIGLITSAGFIYASSTPYYINISNNILAWPSQLNIHPIPSPTGGTEVVDGQPMILGAMVGGPLAAWIFKKLELWWSKYIPSGFEMLINNVSIGIFIAIVAVIWFYGLSAVVAFLTGILTIIVAGLQFGKVTWLLPFVVEPAKVFFLNNALNHGIFTPLGTNEAMLTGKSILFYIETSPGTGLGALLIFYFFSGSKVLKAQALTAIPLVFFGGIHELYFPFILANLFLIPVLMVGGAIAVVLYIIFNAGAYNVVSPGSIILEYTFTHADANSYIGYTLGWIADSAFTFIVGSTFMLFMRKRRGERVFFSLKLQLQNARFQKRLNPKQLDAFSKEGEVKNIVYEHIPAPSYLVEKIIYDNDNCEQFIINNNIPKIVNFIYREETKKKKTKLYLYRIFEKQKPAKAKKTYGFALKPNQYVKRQQINLDVNPTKIKSISYETRPDYLIKRKVVIAKKENKLKTYQEVLDPSLPQMTLNEWNAQKAQLNNLSAINSQIENVPNIADEKVNLIANQLKDVKQIVFACDAGMGSSAMGAGILRNMLKEYKNLNITATNKAIKNLNEDDLFIITQRSFEPLIKEKGINQNKVYYINQFLAKADYEKLKQALEELNKQNN